MYQAIVFLPLIGAIFAGFFGRLFGARASEVVTTSLVLVTALLSWFAFYQVAIEGFETRIELARFIHSGALQIVLGAAHRHAHRGDAGGGDHRVGPRAPLFHRLHA